MSVDCNAFIGYGFWLTADEYQEYLERMKKEKTFLIIVCMLILTVVMEMFSLGLRLIVQKVLPQLVL